MATQGEVEMSERKLHIARIRRHPKELAEAVRGLDRQQLDTPYRAGGWTVAQVVHHLADSHMQACARMRLIATEERPSLKPYDQDAWAALPDARAVSIAPSMTILRGLHRRWAAFLAKLPRKAWGRTGLHPERGEVSIDDLLLLYANHGEKHVAQILGLRSERSW
jgi:uncharacterized damage-inducible protein DinB